VNERQDAAVRYASAGWPVFPCKPDAKEPATTHGVLDAETERYPLVVAASRGQCRGRYRRAGPTVLDVDIANGKPGPQEPERGGPGRARAVTDGAHPHAVRGLPSLLRGQRLDAGARPGPVRQGRLRRRPPSTVGGRPYVVVSHSAEPAIEFAAIRQHLAPQPQRPAWRPREGREPAVAHLAACPAAHLRRRLLLELVMGDEFSGKAGSRYRYRGNTIPGPWAAPLRAGDTELAALMPRTLAPRARADANEHGPRG
jgi:hypothetical protein